MTDDNALLTGNPEAEASPTPASPEPEGERISLSEAIRQVRERKRTPETERCERKRPAEEPVAAPEPAPEVAAEAAQQPEQPRVDWRQRLAEDDEARAAMLEYIAGDDDAAFREKLEKVAAIDQWQALALWDARRQQIAQTRQEYVVAVQQHELAKRASWEQLVGKMVEANPDVSGLPTELVLRAVQPYADRWTELANAGGEAWYSTLAELQKGPQPVLRAMGDSVRSYAERVAPRSSATAKTTELPKMAAPAEPDVDAEDGSETATISGTLRARRATAAVGGQACMTDKPDESLGRSIAATRKERQKAAEKTVVPTLERPFGDFELLRANRLLRRRILAKRGA